MEAIKTLKISKISKSCKLGQNNHFSGNPGNVRELDSYDKYSRK